MKAHALLICAIPFVAAAAIPVLSANPERDAVERAVLDYVEGVYEMKPELIDRGVHPELAKRGLWRPNASTPYREYKMNFQELRELAINWNRNGRVDPATAIKRVEILDMLDATATVKLTADWGVDYMHLARYDGTWKIVNVLWQSHPAASF